MTTSASSKSENLLLLPPQFLAPAAYYAAMTLFSDVVIDTSMRFNKRFKSTHRTMIADANGTAMITVPIEKPASLSAALWSDIKVSAHGNWWNVMVTALRSAYGRTPYFEFYIDDFLPLIESRTAGKSLMELDLALDAILRRHFLIDAKVSLIPPQNINKSSVSDFRFRNIDFTVSVEYYQLRAENYGFQPGLSAVDLLFNMGPEAAVVLRRMADMYSVGYC